MTFKEFLDEISLRSKHTATEYSRKVKAFSQFVLKTSNDPDRLVEAIKTGKVDAYKELKRRLITLGQAGKSPSTLLLTFASVQRFLETEGLASEEKAREVRRMLPHRYAVTKDRVPTVEELKGIIHALKLLKYRALVLLLATSGMRIGECLSLRVREVDLNSSPPRIRIPAERTKTRQERMVFFTPETRDVLKQYIEDAELKPGDYLFPATKGGAMGHLDDDSVEVALRNALRNEGLLKKDASGKRFDIRVHSLRKFFRTRLSADVMDPAIRELLMGHATGIDSSYFRPTEEELAQAYEKAIPKLTIMRSAEMTETNVEIAAARMAAAIANLKDAHVLEELEAVLNKRLGMQLHIRERADYEKMMQLLQVDPKKTMTYDEYIMELVDGYGDETKLKQLVISESDLEGYMAKGFEVKYVLPSGKIVIAKL